MGKIQPNKYAYKPEGDEEDPENRPAFIKEDGDAEDEEELTIEQEGASVSSEEEEEETPPAPTKEEAPKYQFKTEEELEKFLASRTPKPPVPPKPPKEEEEEEDDDLSKIELFKGYKDPETGKWVGEAPDDWNDFARKIMQQLSPKVYAPKILKQIQSMTKKEQAELESINAEFDAEFDELATQGLVPARGTKEGDAINAAISILGGQYGLTSIKKAYDIWSKIPKEKGGGLDYKPAPAKTNPSKMASRMIGSSTKTQNAGKPQNKMSYAKLHSARNIDELLDDE